MGGRKEAARPRRVERPGATGAPPARHAATEYPALQGHVILAELLELYAYNRWATARTLTAAAALSTEAYARPLPGSFPSLRATLEHLLSAEAVWLSRWQGDPLGQACELS